MINTRLDPTVEDIRNAQANEILQGPASTHLPVVIKTGLWPSDHAGVSASLHL